MILYVLVNLLSDSHKDHAANLIMHGDANNRWFDKVFQFIVCSNGRVGINGEHSPLDAPAVSR